MLLNINQTTNIDDIKINFDSSGLWVLNIAIGIIMFGVALGITIDDFKRLFKNPKILFVGVLSQFILLPAATFLAILVIKPHPSFALGMMMIAACPGGNISNFMTHLAKGNTALSISLTACATFFALFMTPFNFQFYGNLYEPTSSILKTINLDFFELVKVVILILGIPLICGMYIRYSRERIALRLSKLLKPISIFVFLIIVVVALLNNMDIFFEHIHYVFFIVLGHNFLALLLGYTIARLFNLSLRDQKTLAIETGIQNSGLGLLLIFTFFNGLGGMAILAAFWGIWHIISGLIIATYWSKQTLKKY